VGPTAATLRLVTIRAGAEPELLYAAMRLPAPGAMFDEAIAGRIVFANIDPESGRIRRAQDSFRMAMASSLETHPATGRPLPGLALPHFRDAVIISLKAHAAFPGHALLGWDIFLTDRGPVLNEANSNPFRMIYQRAAGHGLLNPDLAPKIEAALAAARKR
jgi:glutathione synthase/RimK-type ligase-like ATP-grasp enzyme